MAAQKAIDALGLPPLPPMPGKAHGAAAPATVEKSAARLLAEGRAERSHVPSVDGEGTTWCSCGYCGRATHWWGTTWGRWDTAELQTMFVRDKRTRKTRMIKVPVTVAGRTCAGCTLELKKKWNHRAVAEPAVTMNKKEYTHAANREFGEAVRRDNETYGDD